MISRQVKRENIALRATFFVISSCHRWPTLSARSRLSTDSSSGEHERAMRFLPSHKRACTLGFSFPPGHFKRRAPRQQLRARYGKTVLARITRGRYARTCRAVYKTSNRHRWLNIPCNFKFKNVRPGNQRPRGVSCLPRRTACFSTALALYAGERCRIVAQSVDERIPFLTEQHSSRWISMSFVGYLGYLNFSGGSFQVAHLYLM